MVRLTRQQTQEATRNRLLDAAATLFASQGYASTTVEQIAELAGHTRSAVYKAIGGKETVFLAVTERRAEAERADWAARILAGRTDEERLTAFAEFILDRVPATGRWNLAVGEFLAAVADDPDVMARVLADQHAADERAAAVVLDLCRSLGVEPPLPADELSVILMALANGLAPRAMLDPTFDLRRTVTDAINLMLRGEPLAVQARPAKRGATR